VSGEFGRSKLEVAICPIIPRFSLGRVINLFDGELFPFRVGKLAWQASAIRLRLTSGATRRRRRLWPGKQVTVAPGSERGELGSEEETDYATTE
jgi:hypothetical protein